MREICYVISMDKKRFVTINHIARAVKLPGGFERALTLAEKTMNGVRRPGEQLDRSKKRLSLAEARAMLALARNLQARGEV